MTSKQRRRKRMIKLIKYVAKEIAAMIAGSAIITGLLVGSIAYWVVFGY